jgi:general stress protein 26
VEKKALAVVATVGGEAPQTRVVWFEWTGSALQFRHYQAPCQVQALQKNPRISVLILDPDDDHRYLELRGEAKITVIRTPHCSTVSRSATTETLAGTD